MFELKGLKSLGSLKLRLCVCLALCLFFFLPVGEFSSEAITSVFMAVGQGW